MIEIDGSIGEGGGQVLRTSLSLSCVLSKPVRVFNIRKGRNNPGLQAQHLSACMLLADISGASVKGAEMGSTEIIFEPGEIKAGDYKFNIGTAGSCSLLLQAALPVLLFAKGKCTLEATGGTHVRASPVYEYFSNVFLPAAEKFGAKCNSMMERAGFFPKGGGCVRVETGHSELKGHLFGAEKAGNAHYSILCSSLPPHVADREESEIAKILSGREITGAKKEVAASCAGNAVTVWCGAFGASALGERGKRAEDVAKEACSAFNEEINGNATVDSHLADQLLLYAALAKGKTKYTAPKITGHLETNATIIRAMTGRNISIDGNEVSIEK